MSAAPHIPVMLDEALEALAPRGGEIYVDGTLGAAGYAKAIMSAAHDARVYGIDQDPWAIENAKGIQGLETLHGNFADMEALLAGAGVRKVHGIVLDIGVSSVQLDRPGRGFSFREDGPLDMRMNTNAAQTAADIVNAESEAELADIFYYLGEERHARKIARAIMAARKEGRIDTTFQLAEIVRRSVPHSRKDKSDPATKTFLALRIAVNDELGALKKGLAAAERLLAPEGRLVVVTFHSLEDRIVKDFFTERSGRAPNASRHLPAAGSGPGPTFRVLKRKVRPSEAEIARNPRARSATLRAGIRTREPAREVAA